MPHNLTRQGTHAIVQPQCENREAAQSVCLLAFLPGRAVFSVTSGYLKSPVRKHTGSWHQPTPKIPPVSWSSCLHASVHPPLKFDPRNFLCCGLFWFCFIYFSLRGTYTTAPPTPQQQCCPSGCAFLCSLDCNHSELQWSECRETCISRALDRVAGLHTWIGLFSHRVGLSEQV